MNLSTKFQITRVAFHHPASMGNYQTLYSKAFALSILWMVYYLPVQGSVWSMRVVAKTLVSFGKIGFKFRTNWGEVCSGGLLWGIFVLSFYMERWQPNWMVRLKVYFSFGWSTGFLLEAWIMYSIKKGS